MLITTAFGRHNQVNATHYKYKNAIVTPLHKKHSLPQEDLSSYRPISNLNFVSKIIERMHHSF